MQWGDVGTWFSGLATLAAVVVALYFSIRQEARASELINSQVYAWAQFSSDEGWQLSVSNRTAFPIYDWKVQLDWRSADGQPLQDNVGQDQLGLLPPSDQPWRYPWDPQADVPTNDAHVTATVEFIDARGDACRRDAHGKLIRRPKKHG